jgi:hypothetical protein
LSENVEAPDLLCSSINVGAGVPQYASAPPSVNLTETNQLLRALCAMTQNLMQVAQQQLELMKRAEDRFQKQMAMQKEDFDRWVGDNPDLVDISPAASEAVRSLLGQTMTELVRHVNDNGDNIFDSDYVRQEMVDKYGAQLNHLSAMYGLIRRIAMNEQNQNNDANNPA